MISNKRIIWKLALFLAHIIYAMIFQGSRSIWDPDKGHYINIAVRMLRTGGFIGHSQNDDLPHFVKPPLAYWAIAGGIKLLGWNEWGARMQQYS